MMALRFCAVLALASALEPEEEMANLRQLQHSSGGHSSGGHSSGGHSSGGHSMSYVRRADSTKTGCTPKKGSDLPVTTADSPDPVNEPCYGSGMVSVCKGYVVCCVKINTCVSVHGGRLVSSNAKYYTGGCWSASSSKGSIPATCAKQGECNAAYLYHMFNATTEAGAADPTPSSAVTAFMEGATENATGVCGSWSDSGVPQAGLSTVVLIIIIVVAVLVVVGGGAGAFMMMKKGAPTKQAGAPDNAVQAGAPDNAVTEA